MKINKIWLNIIYILLIVFGVLILLSPLVKPGFIISDDGDWMIIRLSAFFQSLREGQFPVRFLGRLNYGFGYPVANFLYPGFLYIGSLIHILGFSFVDTIKVIIFGSVLGSSLIIFFCLRRKYDLIVSFWATTSFIFSPYLIFDIYKRGSIGEILAFFPAFLSLYSVQTKNKWLLTLAITLLIISHNSLALLFLLVLVGYMLIIKYWDLIPSLLLGLGASTFFWLPAILEKKYVIFDLITVSSPKEYFAWGKYINLLGLAGIVSCVVILLNYKFIKKSTINIYILIIYILSLFFALPISELFWSNQIVAKLFQFPYRFLAINIFVAPWLIAEVIHRFLLKRKLFLYILIMLIISPVYRITKIETISRSEGYYTTNEATTTVADEYMPYWVIDKPNKHAQNKIDFYQGNGEINLKKISTQKILAEIQAKEDSQIQINSIYYPGWGVMVNDIPVQINYQNSQGLIRFFLPKGNHVIKAEFRETPVRFLADVISLISFILYVFYLVSITKSKYKK